jgi:uncharacterized protein YchJ
MSTSGVHMIGKINTSLFESIMTVLTDEVIITEKQIAHIKARHPQDFEQYSKYIPQVLSDPDYILETNMPSSAVMLKKFTLHDVRFQLILRIKAHSDEKDRKNSVITYFYIRKKEWDRLIKNKKILYKSE